MFAELKTNLVTEPRETGEIPQLKIYPIGYTPESKRYLRKQGVEMDVLGFLTAQEVAVTLARVSRNPGGFLEIAKTVDEEGAGEFLRKWASTEAGYGHKSIAELLVIWMCFENMSSFAGDRITHHRLLSPVEFSARFRGRQELGFHTPDTIKNNPDLFQKWIFVHRLLFSLNDLLVNKGVDYIRSEEGREREPERRADKAKGVKTVSDQFKDLLTASRLTSMGVAVNAREAEHVIRTLLSSPYPEAQRIGAMFKEQCLTVAPTLVRYTEENPYMVLTREGTEFLARHQLEVGEYPPLTERPKVELVEYDPFAEERIIAASLYSRAAGKTFSQLLEEAKRMSLDQKKQIFEVLLGNLGVHDTPLRALEFGGDYQIEIPGMTYGIWREFRRHRIQTQDIKELSVDYGYMIPPLAYEMDASQDPQYNGCVDAIHYVMAEVAELYEAVKRFDPLSAPYCVTRLHYHPAIVKINPRQTFNLIGLRSGPTAHPYIRQIAWAFYHKVKEVHPILAEHLGRRLYAEGRPTEEFKWTY